MTAACVMIGRVDLDKSLCLLKYQISCFFLQKSSIHFHWVTALVYRHTVVMISQYSSTFTKIIFLFFYSSFFLKKTPLKMEVFYSFPPLKDYWEQVGFFKKNFNKNIFLLSKSTKFKIIEQNFFLLFINF